jgi:uncharacterized lipoprotein YajG
MPISRKEDQMKTVFLLIALLPFCACSVSKDTTAAVQAVKQFHEQFGSAQDDAIYDAADSQYQHAISKEVSRGFLARVRRKMGAIKSTSQTSYYVNMTTGGIFITLQYKTQCANGKMDESFVWHMENDQARLVRYNVNSPLLLAD